MEYPYESHINIINQSNPIHIQKITSNEDDYIHWHENIELMYFIKGGCTVSTDVSEMKIADGDLVVMTPGSVHSVKCKNHKATYIYAIIDNDFLKSMDFYTNRVVIRRRVVCEEIQNLFGNIINELEDKIEYSKASIQVSIMSVLLILFRKFSQELYQERIDTPKLQLVKKVTKYIREHYKEDLSLEKIATSCGYTKFYVSRAFKEVSGTTVSTYLNTIRVYASTIPLINGNMSINDISAEFGFSDPSYFGKVFKKLVGFTPLEYRAQKNQAIK